MPRRISPRRAIARLRASPRSATSTRPRPRTRARNSRCSRPRDNSPVPAVNWRPPLVTVRIRRSRWLHGNKSRHRCCRHGPWVISSPMRQAEAQLDTARATTDDLRSQVELQVWQAYQDLRTAGVTLDSSAAQLKSAQLAADVSSARYKSGLDTVLEAPCAQSTLAYARVLLALARRKWAAARAALGHAGGGPK